MKVAEWMVEFCKETTDTKPKLNVSVVQVRVNCESAVVMGRGVERKRDTRLTICFCCRGN